MATFISQQRKVGKVLLVSKRVCFYHHAKILTSHGKKKQIHIFITLKACLLRFN